MDIRNFFKRTRYESNSVNDNISNKSDLNDKNNSDNNDNISNKSDQNDENNDNNIIINKNSNRNDENNYNSIIMNNNNDCNNKSKIDIGIIAQNGVKSVPVNLLNLLTNIWVPFEGYDFKSEYGSERKFCFR